MTDQFFESCRDGDLEGVQAALQGGVDVNSKDWAGRNGLAWAFINKHNAVANLLLEQEGIEESTVDRAKAEQFVQFCSDGDLEAVQAALQGGVDVNSQDRDGWTGLMRALERGHTVVENFLLEQDDFDISVVNGESDSALHIAAMADSSESFAKLLARSDSNTF